MGVHAVGGGGRFSRKKERKKDIAHNKNPEQLPGRDQLVFNVLGQINLQYNTKGL